MTSVSIRKFVLNNNWKSQEENEQHSSIGCRFYPDWKPLKQRLCSPNRLYNGLESVTTVSVSCSLTSRGRVRTPKVSADITWCRSDCWHSIAPAHFSDASSYYSDARRTDRSVSTSLCVQLATTSPRGGSAEAPQDSCPPPR